MPVYPAASRPGWPRDVDRFQTMTMRTCILFILLLAGTARAQVELVFQLEYSDFLELEPIQAIVTLANRAPRELKRGEDYALSFDVEDSQAGKIKARSDASFLLPARLGVGEMVSFTNDLSALYRIDRQGAYSVAARVVAGGRALVSKKVYFDVVPGAEAVSLESWTPDGDRHVYSLRVSSRGARTRIALRIDDLDKSLCYGVIDLGRFVQVRPPELKVDPAGLVHVLHMTAPHVFLHSVYKPDGHLVSQKTYPGDAMVVRLEPDPAAGFRVAGVGISKPKDPMLEGLPGPGRL